MFDDIIAGEAESRAARQAEAERQRQEWEQANRRRSAFAELRNAGDALTELACLQVGPEHTTPALARFLTALDAVREYRDQIEARLATFDWDRARASEEERGVDHGAIHQGLRRICNHLFTAETLSPESAQPLIIDPDLRLVACRVGILLYGAMVDLSGAAVFVRRGFSPVEVESTPMATPDAPATLSYRQREFLEAAYRLGAVNEERRKRRDEIARKAAPGDHPSSFSHACSDLKKRGLIMTQASRTGGVWLTPDGLELAKTL